MIPNGVRSIFDVRDVEHGKTAFHISFPASFAAILDRRLIRESA